MAEIYDRGNKRLYISGKLDELREKYGINKITYDPKDFKDWEVGFYHINGFELFRGIGAEILKVAYGKIGIPIEMAVMPGKRALKESSKVKADGEVHRIFKIGEVYPTLIRVPTPIN